MAGTGPLSGQGDWLDFYRKFYEELIKVGHWPGLDVNEMFDGLESRECAEMKLEFGKYRGQDLMDVPRDYVEWLIESREKDLQVYRAELSRREQAEAANETDMEKIVKAGFKAMVKESGSHPDLGGTADDLQRWKNARTQLEQIMSALKAG